jgi:hypothetical protein
VLGGLRFDAIFHKYPGVHPKSMVISEADTNPEMKDKYKEKQNPLQVSVPLSSFIIV